MAETLHSTTSNGPRNAEANPVTRFFRATEIDTRLLGMVGALLIIWIGFQIMTGGLFLTPRNLWNLSVQTSSVAVMATGMVLVIVTRNIDLSVGSMLGVCGMVMGVLQAQVAAGSISASSTSRRHLDHHTCCRPSWSADSIGMLQGMAHRLS